MPRKLETPELINATVEDELITAFGVDEENNIIFIKYDRMAADSSIIQKNATHTLTGVEVADVITRASTIAGTNVRAAIKQALYEALPGNAVIS